MSPILDEGANLPRLYDSLCGLSGVSWIWCISDNCSNDDTFKILSSFSDHRIRYQRLESRVPSYVNWRRAADLAHQGPRSKYVQFIAGDDIIIPSDYSLHLERADAKRAAVACPSIGDFSSWPSDLGERWRPRNTLSRILLLRGLQSAIDPGWVHIIYSVFLWEVFAEWFVEVPVLGPDLSEDWILATSILISERQTVHTGFSALARHSPEISNVNWIERHLQTDSEDNFGERVEGGSGDLPRHVTSPLGVAKSMEAAKKYLPSLSARLRFLLALVLRGAVLRYSITKTWLRGKRATLRTS